MLELILELDAASSLLSDAIQRYITACYAIKNFYVQTTGLEGVPRALSDRVASELVSATSYETNVKRARSALGQARNCSPTITPIHTLPTEVLARSFKLIVGARPCNTSISDNSGVDIQFPKYPDLLSHVCSRWRYIALGLPALWSHIDLVAYHPLSQGFIYRAEAWVARAGHLSLEIHIRQALEAGDNDDEALFAFLTTSAKRVSSLELAVPEASGVFEMKVLQCLLGRCTPGIFNKLAVTYSAEYAPTFIEAQARDDPEDFDIASIWLPLATKCFETVLLPVTVLRLDGLYPFWTSQAYQGLIELYLTCTLRPKFNISKSELYKILDNSPRLRVLEFGLVIFDAPSESLGLPDLQPVHLEQLEVLNLRTLGSVQLDIFLGLITPGPDPLELMISYHEAAPLFSKEHELVKFAKRSNITTLYVEGSGACPSVGYVVDVLPQLCVLALHGFSDERKRGLSQGLGRHPHPDPFSLPKLYLSQCQLDFNALERATKQYSVEALVFWKSRIRRNDKCISTDQAGVELSRLCPIVKSIPGDDPSPIEHWD